MERLTEKFKDGRNILRKGIADIFHVGFGRFFEGEAVDKLAEYEDLEDKGKLLKLPCAVGDMVYIINTLPSGKTVIGETTADAFICALGMLDGRFGETIFLTEEAAEAKLAEMEGKK